MEREAQLCDRAAGQHLPHRRIMRRKAVRGTVDSEDVTEWDHWLEYLVDGTSVQLVRPSDTDRPFWAAYEETRYLGTVTVHGQFDLDGRWHVQPLNERHLSLDDAVRALRRSRPRTRPTVGCGILRDPHLLAPDVQTTALHTAWAVQIGATDRDGNTLFGAEAGVGGRQQPPLPPGLAMSAECRETALPLIGTDLAGIRQAVRSAQPDQRTCRRTSVCAQGQI
jgi:hypothetical protein